MNIDWRQFKDKKEAIAYIMTLPEPKAITAVKAEKWLRGHLPGESHYQKKVMEAIKEVRPDAFVWKIAAGPYGRGGIPDVCAIIDGKYYGFEVKRPLVGKVSDLQKKTARDIEAAGGKVYFVSWPEEIYKIFGDGGRPGSGKRCR